MKPVVQCAECAKCAVRTSAGFISEQIYICTDTGIYVDLDDGCTFGEPGVPRVAVDDCRVSIEGLSATNAW